MAPFSVQRIPNMDGVYSIGQNVNRAQLPFKALVKKNPKAWNEHANYVHTGQR